MTTYFRNWKNESDEESSTPPFHDWIQNVVWNSSLDVTDADARDHLLLATKPSQKAMRYTKMLSYGSHFAWMMEILLAFKHTIAE